MNYRLLATDVDGTLLGSDYGLPRANAEAIESLQQRGLGFTLATGRNRAGVEELVETLKVTQPVILYNGAIVVEPDSGRTLFEAHLSDEAVGEALSVWRHLAAGGSGRVVDVVLYAGGQLFVEKITHSVQENLDKDGLVAEVVGDLSRFVQGGDAGPVTKLLLIGPEDELLSFRGAYAHERYASDLVTTYPQYLEVMPSGISKGAALEMLCGHLEISMEQVVSVGDAPNDTDMIERAGFGVAVQNAHPEVLRAADYVAPSSDDGAVAHVIDRFFRS